MATQLALLAAGALAAAGAAGCGRSDESRAAEQAQDACIGALEPVSNGEVPSPAVLRQAVAHAEAAAAVDDRWRALRVRLGAAVDSYGTPAFGPAVDAVVGECDRVNEIVRRGGREEPAESESAATG